MFFLMLLMIRYVSLFKCSFYCRVGFAHRGTGYIPVEEEHLFLIFISNQCFNADPDPNPDP